MIELFPQPSPNAIAEQLTGRGYLSWSALRTYQSCPLRYFFRYVEGLPEETISSSLVFGGAIHSAIELHFNELLAGNSAPAVESLLEVFWQSWRDRYEEATVTMVKGEDARSIAELAGRVLKAFSASDVAKPNGRILGVEEELRGEIVAGVPDLLARVDLIVETDHELVITDFKTARSRWSSSHATSQAEQLLLYSELAGELAPGKRLRLEFAVLTKAKFPTVEQLRVPFDEGQMRRTRELTHRVWRAIEQQNFYPTP